MCVCIVARIYFSKSSTLFHSMLTVTLCISFLELLQATQSSGLNNANLFSHTSGGLKSSYIRVLLPLEAVGENTPFAIPSHTPLRTFIIEFRANANNPE